VTPTSIILASRSGVQYSANTCNSDFSDGGGSSGVQDPASANLFHLHVSSRSDSGVRNSANAREFSDNSCDSGVRDSANAANGRYGDINNYDRYRCHLCNNNENSTDHLSGQQRNRKSNTNVITMGAPVCWDAHAVSVENSFCVVAMGVPVYRRANIARAKSNVGVAAMGVPFCRRASRALAE
jgi:hypothetical protein